MALKSNSAVKNEKNPLRRALIRQSKFLIRRLPQARSMYLPVRVSILIFSPVLMNSGACTVMPVSMMIAFCTLLAESPRTPSGASVTVKITLEGSSIETALSSTKVTVTAAFSTR